MSVRHSKPATRSEKASDATLLEPDWLSIMDCVDLVRSGDVQPKLAIAALVKRVKHENPHVAHHALLVLESATKNCGDKVSEHANCRGDEIG